MSDFASIGTLGRKRKEHESLAVVASGATPCGPLARVWSGLLRQAAQYDGSSHPRSGPGLARRAVASAACWAPLSLILMAAAILRLAALGHAPLWEDEAATAGFAALPWDDLLHGLGRLETNPPTFYAIEKLWTGVWGGSDWVLRVPSAVAGTAAVGVVWATTRAAFGARAALWAAALLAVQPQHLEYSREARVYALLFLAVAVAMHGALGVVMARRAAWRPAVTLGVAAGSAMLLHYTGALAAAAVFLGAGVAAGLAAGRDGGWAGRFGLLAGAGVLAVVVALPVLAPAATLMQDGGGNASWIPVPDLAFAVTMLLCVAAAPMAGLRTLPAEAAAGVLVLAFAAVAVAVGWGVRRGVGRDAGRDGGRDAAGRPVAWLHVAGLLGGFGLMVAVSQYKPVLIERTLLFALVFLAPLMGGVMAGAGPRLRVAVLAMLAAGGLPGLLAVFQPTRHQEDWPALAAALHVEAGATGWPVAVRGGFEALALDRSLPAGSPARPRLMLTPAVGGALNDAVGVRMGAAAVAMDAGPAALCAALGPAAAGGVLLVLRQDTLLGAAQPRIEALLQAAGGRAAGWTALGGAGSLAYARWPGVCAGEMR